MRFHYWHFVLKEAFRGRLRLRRLRMPAGRHYEMSRKSTNPPWALHYEEGHRQTHSGQSSRQEKYFGAGLENEDHERENIASLNQKFDNFTSNNIQHDERTKLNHKISDHEDWKRPSSIAPKWAAGGIQELLVGSPNPGRKVQFLRSQPPSCTTKSNRRQ